MLPALGLRMSSAADVQEFDKHHQQPGKYVKLFKGFNSKTGVEFSCDVGYERFLGPEVFFNPEIYSSAYTTPLPQASPFLGLCMMQPAVCQPLLLLSAGD